MVLCISHILRPEALLAMQQALADRTLFENGSVSAPQLAVIRHKLLRLWSDSTPK